MAASPNDVNVTLLLLWRLHAHAAVWAGGAAGGTQDP
jgi:hypothetical protein